MPRHWKVGELAEATGLTVRTLHHWDELGLVEPSRRTTAGHRLYDDTDVRRTYTVVALRELGLSLEAVGEALREDAPDVGALLAAHVGHVRTRLAALRRLDATLTLLTERVRRVGSLSSSDLVGLIEEVTTVNEKVERYYTPEQLETLRQRREQLGEEGMNAVLAQWPALIASVQAEMDAGTDPAEHRVQELAARWKELLAHSYTDDPAIWENARRLATENPTEAQAGGAPTPEMMEYVSRADAARDR